MTNDTPSPKTAADAARAQARDGHASRAAKRRDRRADPEMAEQAEKIIEGLEQTVPKKNRGGRPKGSKDRSLEARLRERILRTIYDLDRKTGWLTKLCEKHPYLATQLLKRLVGPSSQDARGVTTDVKIRLEFDNPEAVEESMAEAGKPKKPAPLPESRPKQLQGRVETVTVRTEPRELSDDEVIERARRIENRRKVEQAESEEAWRAERVRRLVANNDRDVWSSV